jgi:hypothetical protein
LFGATGDGGTNGGSGNGDGTSVDLTQAQLITKAAEAYNKALEAQKEGRWADYGTYMQDLQRYLELLNSMTQNTAANNAAALEEGITPSAVEQPAAQ